MSFGGSDSPPMLHDFRCTPPLGSDVHLLRSAEVGRGRTELGSFFCDESVIRECPPGDNAGKSGVNTGFGDDARTPGVSAMVGWWVIARSAGVIAGAGDNASQDPASPELM